MQYYFNYPLLISVIVMHLVTYTDVTDADAAAAADDDDDDW